MKGGQHLLAIILFAFGHFRVMLQKGMAEWNAPVDIVPENSIVGGLHQVDVGGEERIDQHDPKSTQVFVEEITPQFHSNPQASSAHSVIAVLEGFAEAVH